MLTWGPVEPVGLRPRPPGQGQDDRNCGVGGGPGRGQRLRGPSLQRDALSLYYYLRAVRTIASLTLNPFPVCPGNTRWWHLGLQCRLRHNSQATVLTSSPKSAETRSLPLLFSHHSSIAMAFENKRRHSIYGILFLVVVFPFTKYSNSCSRNMSNPRKRCSHV